MADIEKISAGGTSYDVRDANTLRNLTSSQETQILQDGTYNGEEVDNGEVFTTEGGKFKEFHKEVQVGLQDVSQLFDGKNIYASSDKFFYVSSNSATYGYSPNGVDWSTGTLPSWITGGNERVFFVNGSTLKIANCRYSTYNGYTFSSTDDGATWSYNQMNMQGQTKVSKGWYLSGGLYVMCSDIRTNTTLYYSIDAINWSDGVSGMPESDYGSCFCSDGTYLYLLGTSGKFYKTTDCVNWTEIGTSTEVATSTTCLEFYQGKFWIYKSMDGNGYDNIFSTLKYSTDGLTWSSVPTITTSITNGQTKSAFRLNYCGDNTTGQFILCIRCLATGSQTYSSSDYYYVSSNGVDWEEKTFDETYVAQYSNKYGIPTNFASTGSDFVIASSANKSYKGSATVNYIYSLTNLNQIDQTYDSTSANAQSGVAVASAVSGKQDILVSGTNIKTINNESLLGSGNIDIQSGGASSLTDIAVAGSGITLQRPAIGFDVVGNPTISSAGVASGFSDSNYLTCQNIINNAYQSFELVTAVELNTTSAIDGCAIIDATSPQNIRLTLTSDAKIRLRISTTGSASYSVDITGTTVLTTNTKYWIKVTYSSTEGYDLYTSTNGTSWTQEAHSVELTKPYYNAGIIKFGDNNATGYSLDGSIYLADTHINVNGYIFWEAYNADKTSISAAASVVDQVFSSSSANAQSGVAVASAISGKQDVSNLVTSVSSSSTNSQYPSAKLFYDTCGDIETLINAL